MTPGHTVQVQRMGGEPADLWSAVKGKGHSNPQRTLDRWTDIRHQIVHQGKKPTVWRPRAREFIEFAKDLVAEVDRIAEASI